MNRVVIVHGWTGKPESNWFPWLATELRTKGVDVVMPQFPPDQRPKLNEWLAVLCETKPDGNTVLVGHSLGVITILRYLEKTSAQVKGAVLVSGFATPIDIDELSDFFQSPVDFANVKEHCAQFAAINSDNDPYVPLAQGEMIAHALGVQLTIAHHAGHISEVGGFTKYPPILHAVEKMLH